MLNKAVKTETAGAFSFCREMHAGSGHVLPKPIYVDAPNVIVDAMQRMGPREVANNSSLKISKHWYANSAGYLPGHEISRLSEP